MQPLCVIVLFCGVSAVVSGLEWTKPQSDLPLRIDKGEDLLLEWEYRDPLSSHFVLISTEYFVVGYWTKRHGKFTTIKPYDSKLEFIRVPIPGMDGKPVGEKIVLKIPNCQRNDIQYYKCDVTLDDSRVYHKIMNVEWKGLENATKTSRVHHPTETPKPDDPIQTPKPDDSDEVKVVQYHMPRFNLRIVVPCLTVAFVAFVLLAIYICWCVKRRRSMGFKKLNEEKASPMTIENNIYRKCPGKKDDKKPLIYP